jgi:hypothetical protein
MSAYALAAYFFIAGELHRQELAAGMTYQECQADLALLHTLPGIRLVCETET